VDCRAIAKGRGFSHEIIRRASGHKSAAADRVYVNITDPLPIMNLVSTLEKTYNSGTKQDIGFAEIMVTERNQKIRIHAVG